MWGGEACLTATQGISLARGWPLSPLLDGKAGALPGGGGGRSCSHGYDLPLHKMMNYFQCGKQRVNKCHLPMSAYISIWLAGIKMFLQDTTS